MSEGRTMRTAEFIRANTKNIIYYAEKIQTLITAQYNEDLSVNPTDLDLGSIKFSNINNINNLASEIKEYCVFMESNIKSYENEEKKESVNETKNTVPTTEQPATE